MMLPYGRRLCVYWRPRTSFSAWHGVAWFGRRAGAWLLWVWPVLIVVYVVRVSWVDLDRKVERAYQQRQRRAR